MTLGGVGGEGAPNRGNTVFKEAREIESTSFIVSSVTVCHKMKPLEYRE